MPVDSNDRERIDEIAEELHKVLREDELKDAIVLVYANKQDLPNAMDVAEVIERMGMDRIRHHKWLVQACCATSGDGLYEGLDWILQMLSGRKR